MCQGDGPVEGVRCGVWERDLEFHWFGVEVLGPRSWEFRSDAGVPQSPSFLINGGNAKNLDWNHERVTSCCGTAQPSLYSKCMHPRCKAFGGCFVYNEVDGVRAVLWNEFRSFADLERSGERKGWSVIQESTHKAIARCAERTPKACPGRARLF